MSEVHKEPHLIVAYDSNRGIGNNNQIPWMGELPADMKHFKEKTIGNIVLMGRTTYESLGRPLPGRENRVLTTQKNFDAPGCKVYTDSEDALIVDETDERELFVIGGEQIYKLYLPFAHTITSTEIDHSFIADTTFPQIDDRLWEVVEEVHFDQYGKNKYDYSIVTRKRRPLYIDTSKARSARQYEQFRQIEIDNVCPFCTEHLEEYHEGPVIESTEHWNVIDNMVPYKNTDTHFVLIPARHVRKPEELSAEEWADLGELIKKYTNDLPYGGVAFRFGDIAYTAASVAHLHVHILKPEDNLSKDLKVHFKISR